jgi:hypothetical protein
MKNPHVDELRYGLSLGDYSRTTAGKSRKVKNLNFLKPSAGLQRACAGRPCPRPCAGVLGGGGGTRGVDDTREMALGVPGRLGDFTIMRPWAPQHVWEDRLVAALPSGIISVCHEIQNDNLGIVTHKLVSPY